MKSKSLRVGSYSGPYSTLCGLSVRGSTVNARFSSPLSEPQYAASPLHGTTNSFSAQSTATCGPSVSKFVCGLPVT